MIPSREELLALCEEQRNVLDTLRPFNQTQLQNLREWFRIGFIHHSNAIEGNTLTLSEVKVLLEDGITIGGKTVKELKETLNHGDIMSNLDDLFHDQKKIIDKDLVFSLHTQLMYGLLEEKYCGKQRDIDIMVSGSIHQFPLPHELDALLDTFFSGTAKHIKTLLDVATIHREFVKIHPFVDGNGRIARVLMNIALISLGYFPIIIPFSVRNEYIDSLKPEANDTREQFFLRQVYENHKDYLRFLSPRS